MYENEISRFNPYVLAGGMDYLTLVNISNLLDGVKQSMTESRDTLVNMTFEFGQNVEAVCKIEEQLEIINHNIKACKDAILMKEAEPFEHWQEFEALDLHNFCLN
jgi:hypothetical protein